MYFSGDTEGKWHDIESGHFSEKIEIEIITIVSSSDQTYLTCQIFLQQPRHYTKTYFGQEPRLSSGTRV